MSSDCDRAYKNHKDFKYTGGYFFRAYFDNARQDDSASLESSSFGN